MISILLAILIILGGVFRLLTPQQVDVPKTNLSTTNLDGTSSTFKEIIFEGQKFTIPDNLPIAKANPSTIVLGQVINSIVTNYELTKSPKVNDLWEGKNGNLLTKDPYSEQYTFFFPPNNNSGGQILSQDLLIKKAQELIGGLFPNLNLMAWKEKSVYIAISPEPVDLKNWSGEKGLIIPFTYQVNNLPVFWHKQIDSPFELTLNERGEPLTLRFSNFFYVLEEISPKKTINIDSAIINIRLGRGAIISSYVSEPKAIALENIVKANLSQVELEYRFDQQSGLVYPFYRFSGQAVNSDQTVLNIELITPAVETTP